MVPFLINLDKPGKEVRREEFDGGSHFFLHIHGLLKTDSEG